MAEQAFWKESGGGGCLCLCSVAVIEYLRLDSLQKAGVWLMALEAGMPKSVVAGTY